jgi:hypothetical protein
VIKEESDVSDHRRSEGLQADDLSRIAIAKAAFTQGAHRIQECGKVLYGEAQDPVERFIRSVSSGDLFLEGCS